MNSKLTEQRKAAAEELSAALEELESEDGLVSLTAGHGLQSQFFEFRWSEPALAIELHLPFARVLTDDEAQASDNLEIGASIRLAILLLDAQERGELLQPPEASLSASVTEGGLWYIFADAEGNDLDSGSDIEVLAERLELASPDGSEPLNIIWP